MRKLLLLSLLLMPIVSCGTPPAPTIPRTNPCAVPRLAPPPQLHPVDGCLPIDERVALARWIARVNETRLALDGCPLVQLEDQ
jgi:hypothetical protein